MTYERPRRKVTPSETSTIPKPTKDEQKLWEDILAENDLGMDRGLGGRVKDGRRRLVYGHEYFDGDAANEDYSENGEP